MRHEKFDADGVRLHYVIAGSGDPIVLLHGFPQTWFEWRKAIPELAKRYTVIAPDYRGAGDSSRPVSGYDKKTMSADIHALVESLVGDTPINLLGHDMGSFVAFSYAHYFSDSVRKLILVDAPIPGTKLWDELSPALWHVAFHGQRDIAEMLVAGKEREYLQQFFDNRAYRNDALTAEDVEVYVGAFKKPGAMRAGFETYRAIPEDILAHRNLIAEKKLPMPVFIMGGEGNGRGPALVEMGEEFARDVRGVVLPGAAHWIPEEQPQLFLEHLQRFLDE